MTKTVLVTGASRGLGRAVARRLGAEGWHVLALARTMGGLEELDDEIKASGGACTIIPLDLTDAQGVARLTDPLLGRWGKLDALVHCAAAAPPLSPAAHIADKDLTRAFDVNALALPRLLRALDPVLAAANSPAIVICTDDRAGAANWSAYGASKAAGAAFARAYAEEKSRLGFKVNLHQPPAMPTALRSQFFPGEDRSALTPCADAAETLCALL